MIKKYFEKLSFIKNYNKSMFASILFVWGIGLMQAGIVTYNILLNTPVTAQIIVIVSAIISWGCIFWINNTMNDVYKRVKGIGR